MTARKAGTGRATALIGPVLMLGQVVSLQAGAAVAKDAYSVVSPTVLAGMRLAFAALVMWMLVRPRLRTVTRRQWHGAILLGLVFAAMNVAYFQTIKYLPLGLAATLELLGPLALSIALSRRPAHAGAALLALVGVALLAGPGAPLPATGIALGGLAAAVRAGYVILNQRVGRLFPDFTGLSIALACGSIVLVPIAAASVGQDVAAHPTVIATGFAVALLSSVIPYALDVTLLRRIDKRVFGVLLTLSPAVGALVGFLALGEQLITRHLVAIALVVVAGAWAMRQESRHPPRRARHRSHVAA